MIYYEAVIVLYAYVYKSVRKLYQFNFHSVVSIHTEYAAGGLMSPLCYNSALRLFTLFLSCVCALKTFK